MLHTALPDMFCFRLGLKIDSLQMLREWSWERPRSDWEPPRRQQYRLHNVDSDSTSPSWHQSSTISSVKSRQIIKVLTSIISSWLKYISGISEVLILSIYQGLNWLNMLIQSCFTAIWKEAKIRGLSSVKGWNLQRRKTFQTITVTVTTCAALGHA